MQQERHQVPQFGPSVLPFQRVSITGGTGTVGSQFVKVLLRQFTSVRRVNTTCRAESPRAGRLPEAERLRVVGGTLHDLNTLRRVVDEGDLVYHLAAWLANTPLPDMTEVYVTNCLATGVLAELCARHGKRLVFTSSHSVYFAGAYEGRIRADDYRFRQDFLDWIQAVSGPYGELIGDIIAGRAHFDRAIDAVEGIHAELAPPFDPKIYDSDMYHLYCLTKLLAERLVLERGGIALRLANVYGPGDESPQAVGEACQRLLEAQAGDALGVRQPFKKLVPAHLGDIVRCLIRAATLDVQEGELPLFTVASQERYMREDALLRTVADALNRIRGTRHTYDIEELAPEDETAFSYDLTRMRSRLLRGERLTPFGQGVEQQLGWLIRRAEGVPASGTALTIDFARTDPGD